MHHHHHRNHSNKNQHQRRPKTSDKNKIPETSKLPVPKRTYKPNLSQKDLGERVLIFGDRRGFLRYIGPTHFEAGEWCGIELDLPEGKNDGRIEGTDYFHCLPNHGLFVPSAFVELIKNVQPKKFSLCLRDIESGSSTSSSLAENEASNFDEGRSYLQFKARHRGKKFAGAMKPVVTRPQPRPKQRPTKEANARHSFPTKIPVLESSKRSPALSRRKRHIAGNEPIKTKAKPISDINDAKAHSKSVMTESDMDSSLGILSPTDLNLGDLAMTASQASNQGWTTMTRSRTFTRELNDPKIEHDLVIEDLDNQSKRNKPSVKKFKLNTKQIEADEETSILMSRTEELLHSMPSTSRIPIKTSIYSRPLDDHKYPDVTDTLKFRTESLLYSKSKKKKAKKEQKQPAMIAETATDSSGSSWSNIPRCFNVTTSLLSSDAGISSMPSSMISNVSDSVHDSNAKVHVAIVETPKENVVIPDVICAKENAEAIYEIVAKVRSRSQEKGMASKRAELLAETPIIPNTNVGSKLKEILAENETKNTRSEKREKPKGKWDDIMNQIAESKSDKRKDSKTKLKEVKSKVFADFKPPKLIRPNCNKTRSTTSNSSSSSNGFLGESKRMSSRQSSTLASRSTSSASMASQVIRETTPDGDELFAAALIEDDDDMSECTLKDFAKKVPASSRKDFVKNNAAAVSRKNSTTSRKSSSVNNKTNTTTIAASNSSSSSTVSSAKNGHLRPNSGSHRDQQPDLVKVSSPKLSELSRLESVVDAKTQENAQLRARLGHNAKGFEALAITVNQYAKKLDDWNQLDLFKKLEDLNYLVQSKEAEIEQLRLLHAAPKGDEEVDCKNNVVNDDIEDEREAIIAHLQNRLKITAEEHETFIDKLKQDFKSELELQADSLKIEVKSLESEHENLVQDHEARHREIIHEVEEKWKQKLALQLEEQSTEIQNLHGELERQNEKWSESRRNLEEQLHSVQNELRNQEMAVSAKQKGDLLMKSTQNKLSKVLAEVDSLKAVLEMRTEEIHALRLEKAKLEDKLDDFDRMKISLNKVTAQMEDLKAQLNEKQALERKLSEENRQLYNNMEREKNAQRRLTMEKEELEWKMKSFSAADSAGPMSMSMMETGYCGSPFEGMMGSTPLALQTKGSLTASYSEHAPQSLPPFTGRSRKNRPVSAPPGKFDLASLAKSLKDQSGPDSPRLLEVVEKCDSLSWKIEYQEDEIEAGVAGASCAGASPVLKRKTTPPAQMMTRSLERPIKGKDGQNLMTRSLSRSNSTRKKIIPSFEPLSESTESDSLEEQLQKDQEPVKQPASVDIDDLDDDIGDISSSSEIEIDEPLQEVTTPQIEALMFPPAALACSSSASEANMSSPDAEITIRAELCKKPMTSSMPNYDLNKLFKTVQDSGGEGMMEAFTPSSDMMDSESLHLLSTSNDGSSKPGSEMADSTVSMTSWSTTTDDFSSS